MCWLDRRNQCSRHNDDGGGSRLVTIQAGHERLGFRRRSDTAEPLDFGLRAEPAFLDNIRKIRGVFADEVRREVMVDVLQYGLRKADYPLEAVSDVVAFDPTMWVPVSETTGRVLLSHGGVKNRLPALSAFERFYCFWFFDGGSPSKTQGG